MKNPTQQQAVDEAVRKARRDRILPDERDMIVAQLQRYPLPIVKRNTGRSYISLCRVAEANGL